MTTTAKPKLGLLVKNAGASQLNYYLIRSANKLLDEGKLQDVTLFYEDLARPCIPANFALMQMTEAFGFNGTAIATTVSTAAKLLKMPGPKVKLFFVWDLEWLRPQQKAFRQFQGVYGHPDLKLIARNAEHADIIKRAWNTPVSFLNSEINLEDMLG